MNEPIHITLLGGLQVQQADRLITRFKSQKIGSLLAYLAYHLRQMHSREVLIDLLWPDSSPEAGRNSLSVALSTLRHQLEPPGTPANAVLRADRFSVGLNPDTVTTDVATFEAAIQATSSAQSQTEQTQRLAGAVDLYQGRLLPGFYEEWIIAAQQRMTGLFLESVIRLIDRMEANGDLSSALGYARRAVGMDPLEEQANHHLIRLLAAIGQPGAALRHYKELERLLEEELGEEPSAPLRALARQIEKQSGFTVPLLLSFVSTVPRTVGPPAALDALPQGSVTLTVLMTDIEGSTQLWERAGDAFAQALESHHTLLRREFARFGGQEINEAGDSFVVAFPSAGKALDCAIAGQQALNEHAWPPETGPLRVRMALHTGDVEYREGAYHGLTLHRASRMLTTGHGGQVLCSEATASLVRRDLDEAARLVDLGIWRLRDVPAPERLFQVDYPGMPEPTFPPLSAEAGHAARLPLRFTRFFGREGAITRLVAMLRPDPLAPTSHPRLLTLTGSGGAGKTRLAIEVAERLVEPLQGAVWFTPLADLTDAGLIADAILDSLRLVRSPQREPLDQVVEALSRQPSLLVLDNFEHLVAGGAELVQTLLTRIPTLTVLVTSRQLLGLSGEQEFVVPPLVTPNGGETAEQLSLYESVQLFVDRAQSAIPHFQVTSGNAPAVAELCQRLEGLPLAIELAAARALVLTPGQMLRQLEQRFGFLVSRKRDATERHRTLEAAIDWSYRLLTPELQRFFARLSVFRGGWTVEAAEVVCEETLALDYLAQLRECSLVLTKESVGAEEIRFRMLEALREYADEQLSSAERRNLQQRHTGYFFEVAEAIVHRVSESDQSQGLDRLEAEHDNFRAALKYDLSDESGTQPGLKLIVMLQSLWVLRGHWHEGRRLYAQALSRPGIQPESTDRAEALAGAANLAFLQGDYVESNVLYTQALRIHRAQDNRIQVAGILSSLGAVARYQGDYASARQLCAESLSHSQELGDQAHEASNLLELGILARFEGNYDEAIRLTEAYLRFNRDRVDRIWRWDVLGLSNLGIVAYEQGDLATALARYDEALNICLECGNRPVQARCLNNKGLVEIKQRDFSKAKSLLNQCLTIRQQLGDTRGIAETLAVFSSLEVAQGRFERAARLLGAAETLRLRVNWFRPPSEQIRFDEDAAITSAFLGEEAFTALYTQGSAMTIEQAVMYANEADEL